MTLSLFTYDFPHFKSQEMLLHLLVRGYKLEYVIGAPWKNLGYHPPSLRVESRYTGLLHPKDICRRFNINYIVYDHNSEELEKYLTKHPTDLGIVAGARIIKKHIIDKFKRGILNIHPGLLPEIRGLNTLKWSILKDVPIGNTAHLIDTKIDAGKLIVKEQIDIFEDDSFTEISLRMIQTQPELMIKALEILEKIPDEKLEDLNLLSKDYHSNMPPELEKRVVTLFPKWVKKYATKKV